MVWYAWHAQGEYFVFFLFCQARAVSSFPYLQVPVHKSMVGGGSEDKGVITWIMWVNT